MPDTTLILALDGDVTLTQFAEGVNHFHKLLLQLSQEVAAETTIEWDLEDLHYGSAVIAVVGRANHDEPILRVVSAFEALGQSLQQFETLPFSRNVIREAEALTKLITGDITAIRLATAQREAIVYSPVDAKYTHNPEPMISLGTVKGRVQSISNRGSLRFTLYDSVFDRPISCFIKDDQRHILADIWDKLVYVTGRITRQPDSGQPVSVRDIQSIDLVKVVQPGSYRQARGILAEQWDGEPAEISIRRLRDAED